MSKIPLHQVVALLIDADNVKLDYAEQILQLAEYYGEVKIRLAFRDWGDTGQSSHREKLAALHIDCEQIGRRGKNSTDQGLVFYAGKILGAEFYEEFVHVFILVSGDGDFTSACRILQENGKQVIGISHAENTSKSLREACDVFYEVGGLKDKLDSLAKLHPIPPNEVRELFNILLFAYHGLTVTKDGWVSYAPLGKKMREISPAFNSKFGKYKLSDLLKLFDEEFECRDQEIRVLRGIQYLPPKIKF